MKKYCLILLLSLVSILTFAQKDRRFVTGKHPSGITIGGTVGNETQLKISAYTFNIYFSYSNNFASSQGDLPSESSSQYKDSGQISCDNLSLGGMFRVKNASLYSFYLIPQFTYETVSKLYESSENKGDLYKDEKVNNVGFGLDLMFVDYSGFTAQLGVSTTAGFSAGLGYSF